MSNKDPHAELNKIVTVLVGTVMGGALGTLSALLFEAQPMTSTFFTLVLVGVIGGGVVGLKCGK